MCQSADRRVEGESDVILCLVAVTGCNFSLSFPFRALTHTFQMFLCLKCFCMIFWMLSLVVIFHDLFFGCCRWSFFLPLIFISAHPLKLPFSPNFVSFIFIMSLTVLTAASYSAGIFPRMMARTFEPYR